MQQRNSLTIEEMKKIANEVIKEESKKENVKVDLELFTIIEWYKEVYNNSFFYKLFRQPNILIEQLAKPLRYYFLHPATFTPFFLTRQTGGSITYFLNRTNQIVTEQHKYFNLLFSCYHEFRHAMQTTYDKNSYEEFITNIEAFLMNQNKEGYYYQHDNFFIEADANIYGVRKAKEYLKENYPDLYEKEKETIEKEEKRYYLDYISFDGSDTFERVLKNVRKNNKSEEKNAKQNNREINKKNLIRPQNISPVLPIFLNEDWSFKKISEIVSHEEYNKLNIRITAAILSSKSFLEETNTKELSEEEKELLASTLQYTNTIYQNQATILEKNSSFNKCSLKELKQRKSFYEKYLYINRQLIRLSKETIRPITDFLELTRDEYSKNDHIATIPYYLDEIERTKNQKK